MPKISRCPVCESTSIAIAIAPASTNVSLFCNVCNFRDVIFYGESFRQAVEFHKSIFAQPKRDRRGMRYAVSRHLPPVRAFENFGTPKTRWRKGVLMSHVWLLLGRELEGQVFGEWHKVITSVDTW